MLGDPLLLVLLLPDAPPPEALAESLEVPLPALLEPPELLELPAPPLLEEDPPPLEADPPLPEPVPLLPLPEFELSCARSEFSWVSVEDACSKLLDAVWVADTQAFTTAGSSAAEDDDELPPLLGVLVVGCEVDDSDVVGAGVLVALLVGAVVSLAVGVLVAVDVAVGAVVEVSVGIPVVVDDVIDVGLLAEVRSPDRDVPPVGPVDPPAAITGAQAVCCACTDAFIDWTCCARVFDNDFSCVASPLEICEPEPPDPEPLDPDPGEPVDPEPDPEGAVAVAVGVDAFDPDPELPFDEDPPDEPVGDAELFVADDVPTDEELVLLVVVVAAAAFAWARSAWADSRSAFSPAVSMVASDWPAVTVSPTATFTPVI